MMMGLPEDMIGAIKIKDGLFIGDEFAAQVSLSFSFFHFDSNFIVRRFSLILASYVCL
jgi:hypothetical protein